MSLSYNDAIATLKELFPSTNVVILKQVLNSRQGHMESAIEILLNMNMNTQSAAQQSIQLSKNKNLSSEKTKKNSDEQKSSKAKADKSKNPVNSSNENIATYNNFSLKDRFLGLFSSEDSKYELIQEEDGKE